MSTLSVLFFFTNGHNVLMVLLYYYKGMLEKVTMQITQQLSAFVYYRKALNHFGISSNSFKFRSKMCLSPRPKKYDKKAL